MSNCLRMANDVSGNFQVIHRINFKNQSETALLALSAALSLVLFVTSILCLKSQNINSANLNLFNRNIGWIAGVTAVGSLVAYVCAGYGKGLVDRLKDRKIGLAKEVIQAVILITIAILGIYNHMSPLHISRGIMGLYITTGILFYGLYPCCSNSIRNCISPAHTPEYVKL